MRQLDDRGEHRVVAEHRGIGSIGWIVVNPVPGADLRRQSAPAPSSPEETR
jgi:hypothetical protein